MTPRIYLYLIAFLITPLMTLHAKRAAPPEVPPVRNESHEFRIGQEATGGTVTKQIEVWNLADQKLLKRIAVYEIHIRPNLEADVQDICISAMRFENGILLVINEARQRFYINPVTLELITPATPDSPESSENQDNQCCQ